MLKSIFILASAKSMPYKKEKEALWEESGINKGAEDQIVFYTVAHDIWNSVLERNRVQLTEIKRIVFNRLPVI